MDFSEITDSLYIGTAPRSEDYDILRQLGVELVINMRIEQRPQSDPHDPPLSVLWLPVFDSPLLPIPVRALEKGVTAAVKTISEGGKVYAHCAAGVHRGAAMGATILIAQGYSFDKAIQLIKTGRKNADPEAWYIRRSIQRFAIYWQNKHSKMAGLVETHPTIQPVEPAS